MKTLLTAASGAVFLSGLAGAASAAPGVHLVTVIRALPHGPGVFRYAVTVRPVGGAAHTVTLVLGTRRPAVWSGEVPGCLASRDRTELACDLGDVRESESRTLHATGKPGAGGEAPIVVRVAAANAPPVTSSLGVTQSSALRLSHAQGVWSPGGDAPSARPSEDADGAGGAASPAADPGTVSAPTAGSSADAAPLESPVESPPVESPGIQPSAAEPPVVQPPVDQRYEAVAPAARPHAARPAAPPRGSAARPERPRRAPATTKGTDASAVPAASAGAGAPGDAAGPGAPRPGAHGRPPAVDLPGAPPPAPYLPGAAAAPLPVIGGKAAPSPAVSPSAALPQIAARRSQAEGISELDTASPAGALQAGRTSWATLVAVAVVTEAGLLWLIAGFSVWRRRRSREDGRRRRTRLAGLIP